MRYARFNEEHYNVKCLLLMITCTNGKNSAWCCNHKFGYYRKRGDPRLSCKDDTGCCLLQLGGFRYEYLKVSESIWTEFVLERIILMQSFFIQSLYHWKKLTQRNERHLVIKLCTYIITLFFLGYLDWIFKKLHLCLSFCRVRHSTMNNRVPSTFVSILTQRK